MPRPWYEQRGEPLMLINLSVSANQLVVTTSAGGGIQVSLSTALIPPGTIQLDALATFNGPITLSTALTISGLGSTDPAILGRCWRTTDGLLHVSSG